MTRSEDNKLRQAKEAHTHLPGKQSCLLQKVTVLETRIFNMHSFSFVKLKQTGHFIQRASCVYGYSTVRKRKVPPQCKRFTFFISSTEFCWCPNIWKNKMYANCIFSKVIFSPPGFLGLECTACFYDLSTRSLHKIHSDITQLWIIYSVYPCSTNKIFICIV